MRINMNPAVSYVNRTNNNAENLKMQTNKNVTFEGYHGTQKSVVDKLRNVTGKTIRNCFLAGLGIVAAFITGLKSFQIVDPGHRGVRVFLGNVGSVEEEGLHFKWPWLETIEEVDVRTEKTEKTTEAFTKDIQQATITYAINYNKIPEEVNQLYQKIGIKDYESKVIEPIVYGILKDRIGEYNAQDLISHREEASKAIKAKVKAQLAEKFIDVTDFNMTNIDFSTAFEKAIEEKVTAEQNALKAKNRTVQVEEEAKQTRIAAQAEADKIKIMAEALAKNKDLVELEAVKKWNGVLPTYMMGNTVPFLNVAGTTK